MTSILAVISQFFLNIFTVLYFDEIILNVTDLRAMRLRDSVRPEYRKLSQKYCLYVDCWL